MFGLGLPELLIILVILLLLFGSAKLPKLAKSLGESAGELQKGFEGVTRQSQLKDSKSKDTTKTTSTEKSEKSEKKA
ncbi:twin-arginine translocase TatA/TatE family subunit [Candidatus Saccharibacteria bacterium]|jgi:sec-independent protein translocase protein TatA|nr:twin-arginine translocase TatA/TatE family subunit [Candidatus Saccharibacteria bacterium]